MSSAVMKDRVRAQKTLERDLKKLSTSDVFSATRTGKQAQVKPSQKTASKSSKKAVAAQKAIRAQAGARPPKSRAVIRDRLEEWVCFASDPFGSIPARMPVNYNSAPSNRSFIVRVPYQERFQIDAQKCVEFGIAGHGLYSGNNDPESFHCLPQQIGATDYSIGPVASGSFPACLGYHSPDSPSGAALAVGSASNSTTVVGYEALLPTAPLPFTASGTGGHTRWKLIALGMRFANTSTSFVKGGDLATVQPSANHTVVTPANGQLEFVNESTYKVQPISDKTLQVVLIPRTQDMAYSHTLNAASNSRTDYYPMKAWINNTTNTTQDFTVWIEAFYQIAGFNVNSLTTPSVDFPADRNVVEPAINITRMSASSGSGFEHVARVVASKVSGAASEGLDDLMGRAGKFVGKLATEALELL